jgi:hypothetical protein
VPTTVTNRGKRLIPSGELLTFSWYMGLLTGSADLPAAAHNPDLSTVADLLAVPGVIEVTYGGYAREPVTGIAIAQDDTNNWAEITSDDVSFGVLEEDAGSARGMFICKDGETDAVRDLLMVADMPVKVFNGGTAIVNVTALFRIVQPVQP